MLNLQLAICHINNGFQWILVRNQIDLSQEVTKRLLTLNRNLAMCQCSKMFIKEYVGNCKTYYCWREL